MSALDFIAIVRTVSIRIAELWIGAVGLLVDIGNAVAVRISVGTVVGVDSAIVGGIESMFALPFIQQAVMVGVGVEWIGLDAGIGAGRGIGGDFPEVGNAVTIEVGGVKGFAGRDGLVGILEAEEGVVRSPVHLVFDEGVVAAFDDRYPSPFDEMIGGI